ncbi:MAG TPA: hypothetical protein VHV80_06290 [Steroidobacteraceae bacterium]|jgi:hypothetical protein|nr:hypothetical protein [Steroidobacteraceae bacterium]
MLRNEALVALEVRALSRACWLRREMLEALAEVNHRCLGLLAEQALVPGTQAFGAQAHGAPAGPALRQVGELWRALDERSRWQAAACPYLLVDACFGEPQRWQWLSGSRVGEASGAPYASFFTVPQAAAVARTVFVYAWSLVLNHSAGARVVLGIHPHCASLLGACTVSQVHELAERGCGWLRPRWLRQVQLWRQMLVAAAEDDVAALERARMQGLQMLAAEAWEAAQQSRLAAWGSVPSMRLQ